VHVRYQDLANQIDEQDVFRLTAEQQDLVWRVFILDTEKRDFEYRIIYRASDNRDVDTGWKTSTEEQLTVRDPFPRKRVVQVVPNIDWDQMERCFVDLRYEDPDHSIFEESSIEFVQGDPSKTFSVSMEDPERKQVFFKVTFLFKDGRMIEVPESMTLERRIVVRPDMRGRRIVELRPPTDFAAQRLQRVTAELRYEDFQAGLSINDSFVFEAPETRAYFEFDYADETRDRYEARIAYLLNNGLERTTEWQVFDAPTLRIQAP
jgi:hypothetical protein